MNKGIFEMNLNMMEMEIRILTLVISYLLGSFLTAEVVTRKLTGKPCKYLGTTGNPGMANVMAHLGFKPGITVLVGDVLKVILAMLMTYFLLPAFVAQTMRGYAMATYGITLEASDLWNHVLLYYVALGCCIGHNYTFWQVKHGGKGVAVTNSAMILIQPLWGLLSNIVGMLIVFASQYLGLGAVVIPAIFIIPAFLVDGVEAGIVAILLEILMIIRNLAFLKQIPSGEAERVDVLGAIKKKFF
jgi:glycerol-3-phosphate acyltransferase PlsY